MIKYILNSSYSRLHPPNWNRHVLLSCRQWSIKYYGKVLRLFQSWILTNTPDGMRRSHEDWLVMSIVRSFVTRYIPQQCCVLYDVCTCLCDRCWKWRDTAGGVGGHTGHSGVRLQVTGDSCQLCTLHHCQQARGRRLSSMILTLLQLTASHLSADCPQPPGWGYCNR